MQVPVPWIIVVVGDMNDYCVGAQMNALRTAALASGQTDPFPRMMHDVATRIRAKIQTNEGNVVSATEDAIPPECKWIACYLILDGMQTRIPTLKLTESQKDQIKEAIRQLDRIADGKDLVSTPTNPTEVNVQTNTDVEVVNTEIITSRQTVNATTMTGLL